jgi:hypothetical protein
VTSSRHRPHPLESGRKRTKKPRRANSSQPKEFATESDWRRTDEKELAGLPASQPQLVPLARFTAADISVSKCLQAVRRLLEDAALADQCDLLRKPRRDAFRRSPALQAEHRFSRTLSVRAPSLSRVRVRAEGTQGDRLNGAPRELCEHLHGVAVAAYASVLMANR